MTRNLLNIKKAPLEVAVLLAQDDIICKLLVNDNPTALTDPRPEKTVNEMIQENYVSLQPPVESRIEQYGRNTFVSIQLGSVFTGDDFNVQANLALYVSTDSDHLLLANNRNRILEICDRIFSLLEGRKLSSSEALSVRTLDPITLSEFHAGYRILIDFGDQ